MHDEKAFFLVVFGILILFAYQFHPKLLLLCLNALLILIILNAD